MKGNGMIVCGMRADGQSNHNQTPRNTNWWNQFDGVGGSTIHSTNHSIPTKQRKDKSFFLFVFIPFICEWMEGRWIKRYYNSKLVREDL